MEERGKTPKFHVPARDAPITSSTWTLCGRYVSEMRTPLFVRADGEGATCKRCVMAVNARRRSAGMPELDISS